MTVPRSESETISDALAHLYLAHRLPADGGAADSFFRIRIGRLTLPVPNPPARRRAVFFHDVNHVVTGYDTTFSGGEMEIAGFEVGCGCGPYWIAWYLNLSLVALGLVVCPRAVFAAFVRGRRSSSIYRGHEDRAALSAMSVGEVRAMLRLDREGAIARPADRLHFAGWATGAVATLLAPPLALLTLLWVIVRLSLR